MSGDRPAGLLERLRAGPVICAEGYLFECERRGYLQAGAFVPLVVLDHPEVVAQLHRDFVHAGSDVVQAFTYYGHREKLRIIGKEGLLEPLNQGALAIAGQVARESGTLLAGNLSNTNVWGAASAQAVRAMFDEQVSWAVGAGADFLIGETFSYAAEALVALEAMKRSGLPVVVTMAVHRETGTRDGLSTVEACRRLEGAGADVVGLNCSRGPRTMLPLLAEIRPRIGVDLAALPVPYRTTTARPSMQSLHDPERAERPFPTRLDPFTCTRDEIAEFTRAAHDLGVRYLGLCCGAGPHHIRALAEALGRQPAASRYSEDMSKHSYWGTDPGLHTQNQDYAARL
jgi:betaine-homocysteine S-methyltransferase